MRRVINHPNTDEPTLLTLEEAKRFLRTSRRTLGRLIDAGELPFTLVGKQKRFFRRDLESYLQNSYQTKTA